MSVRISPKPAIVVALCTFAVSALIYAAAPGTGLTNSDVTANTTATGTQQTSAVARDADGDFVVVWAGNGTGDADGVFMRRYNHNGVVPESGTPPTPVNEVRVNTTTAGAQENPAVAMDADGDYVVVWEGPDGTGNGDGIWAQCFGADGTPDGSEVAVNSTVTNEQTKPTVASAADGTFVVAWQSINQDGSGQAIVARRFNANCSAASAEFIVNETPTSSQTEPSIAVEPDGDFAIVWTSNQDLSNPGKLYFRTFTASGTEVVSETRVSTGIGGTQVASSIAVDAQGNLVIVWESADTDGTGIYGRRFTAAGASIGSDFQVNSGGDAGNQKVPAVAMDVLGRFVVTWQSDPSGSEADIFTRRYAADGTAAATETQTNATDSGNQVRPAVAVDADGDYVVAWDGGSSNDAFIRRFAGPEVVDLSIVTADSADPVGSGGTYSYTFTVSNNHGAPGNVTGISAIDNAIGSANGTAVVDTLPSGVTLTTASGTGWTCDMSNGSPGQAVQCDLDTVLKVGDPPTTVTLNVVAPAAAMDTALTNAATISVTNQHDTNGANDTANELTYVCASAAPSVVQFTSASFNAPNETGTVNLTVSRTGGACGTVSVDVTVAAGTAQTPADFTVANTTTTLTWATGETGNKSVPVTIVSDTLDENNETLTATLSNLGERASLGPNTSATATITDDDNAPTVTLEVDDTSLDEAADSATVTARLDTQSGLPVAVTLAYSGANRGTGCGTVQSPDDYTCAGGAGGGSGTTINIPAGSTTGTAIVTAVDDTLDESAESVVVDMTCGMSSNCSESGSQQLTIPIVDNDQAPTVKFGTTTSSVNEASGTATVTFTVQLSTASGLAVTVPVDVDPSGNATSNTDFTYDADTAMGTQTSATIAAGTTSETVTVSIPADTRDEDADATASPLPAETAVFKLGTPTNASLDTVDTMHTVSIIDNDATPTVTLTPAPASAINNESGSATITATLNNASDLTVTVPLAYSGTARRGSNCGTLQTPTDYNCAGGTGGGTGTSITITAGQTSGTATVTAAADIYDEANETVVVDISGTVVNANESGTQQVTTTITDDSADAAPTVNLSVSPASFGETGGTATVTATLDVASGRDVTVPLAYSGSANRGTGCGTVQNPADYTCAASAGTPTALIVPEGSTTATVTITAVSDTPYEGDEIVTVALNDCATNGGGTCQAGATTSVNATLLDDDAVPQVSFAVATDSVDESGGLGTPGQKLVVVQLSRVSDDDVIVPFTVGMGSADAADFSAASSPLLIPAGATSGNIVVTLTDDPNDENDQTVILNLGTPTGATLVEPDEHVLTILDNDNPPAVNFTPATQSVTEPNSGTESVTVNATPAVTSEKQITVPFTVSGSAANPADHGAANGSITILANATGGSTSFNVAADSLDENNETVVLTMGALVNGTAGAANVHTVTVADDAADVPPNVTLSLTGSPLAENGGVATVTATLSGVSGRTVTVDLAYTGTAGISDYTAPATIVIAASSTTGTASITGVDDTLDEAAETVIVDATCGDTTCTEATAQQVTASITDDDASPTVKFSTASQTIAEGTSAGTTAVTVTAQLSAISGQDVVVPFTLGGTSTSADHNAVSTTPISITAGTLSGTYTFNVTRDSDDEPAETVVFTMGTPVNATPTAPTTHTVTITDDDEPAPAPADGGGGAFGVVGFGLLLPYLARRRRETLARR